MAEELKGHAGRLAVYEKIPAIYSKEQYDNLYQRSLEDPDGFWAEQAEKYLSWYKKWDVVSDCDFKSARFAWFGGGTLNASFNCLDRHLDTLKNKIAFYWEGDEPDQNQTITYGELYKEVNKAAAALKARGVGKGDAVVIYMPMVPETVVAMLACARIGAVHCLVLEVFSGEALAYRTKDCQAKMIITADGAMRGGKIIPLKQNVDIALKTCPQVQSILVYERCGLGLELMPRQEWWHEAMADPDLPDYVKPEAMDAEDPLFILYASGSMGTPKGMVHTHGGYLLYAAMTTKLVLDLQEDEIFWCASELGWITGHTYTVYGPLVCGLTGVLFEGVFDYPGNDRLWQICSKYKVNKLYTPPRTIRALAKENAGPSPDCDLSHLRLVATGGEPLSPENWRWYHEKVGQKRCPVVDTWWQAETGGPMFTSWPAATPTKPGSCGFPFFGVEPVIIDPDTGQPTRFPDQEGVLCFKKAWPAMARTMFNDHPRFIDSYLTQVYGAYFTGHAAKIDEDGCYWITGRIDDVIKVNGNRLGTSEIESALVTHQSATEAAVVGYPHPVKGQGIYVFVTLSPEAVKSEELKNELRDLVEAVIGPVATPDFIQWADALPKTRSGKVLRRILQKIAAGNVEDMGDTTTLADPIVLQDLIKDRLGSPD